MRQMIRLHNGTKNQFCVEIQKVGYGSQYSLFCKTLVETRLVTAQRKVFVLIIF